MSKILYFWAVPKYMSMVTYHTTVSPAFVGRIVFKHTGHQRGPKEPNFNLPVEFFPLLAPNSTVTPRAYVFPSIIVHYCIQLQFPLFFNM